MPEDSGPREERTRTAGADVRRPETAEGPVEGLEPGERVERGPWTPPVEVDAPPGRGADVDVEAQDGWDSGSSAEGFVQEEAGLPPSDPAGDPEDEGVPDLQDGTPEQQRANDPQQQPVPGDTPTAATRKALTPNELHEGEPLDERLAEEEPEDDTVSEEPDPSTGLLEREPERAPPRHQDLHARETDSQGGLSGEEEAVRTVNED